MNDATTIPVARPVSAGDRPVGEGRRLRRRHLWLVPGLAIAIFANELGKANGVTILHLIAFGIAPDLPRLLGLRPGGMSPAVLAVFNAIHHPAAPVAAVAMAAVAVPATGLLPVIWLVAALVWLSHVVIGLGVGDVPRPGRQRRDA